jgi:hypothetical protein
MLTQCNLKLGRQAISATGMIMMAVVSPIVAIKFKSMYSIIPPLMLFGLSSPVTLTPILPGMGSVVNELVNIEIQSQGGGEEQKRDHSLYVIFINDICLFTFYFYYLYHQY